MKKTMKMKFLIAGLFLIGLGSVSYGQISIAPEIGANMTNFTSKTTVGNTTSSYDSQYLLGFRAGAVLDVQLTDYLFLQPAVYYNMAKTKEEYYFLGENTATMTVHSFQIPAYIMYKTGTTDSQNFFVGVGPVLGLNFAGNVNTYNQLLNLNTKTDLTFGNDASNNDDMRVMELGASATVGYQFNLGLYVRAHYNLGLSNLNPKDNSNTDTSRKSSSFGLSIGYFL